MKRSDRGHDRQTEPIAWQAPAPVEAVEPIDDPRSLVGRNPGPIVLNHDRNGIRFQGGQNRTVAPLPPYFSALSIRFTNALARRFRSPSVTRSLSISLTSVIPSASAVASESSTTSLITEPS